MWEPSQLGVVTLPSGRRVRGRGLSAGPVADDDAPDLGLYLTSHPHEERWESMWIAWPDFRIPRNPDQALAALRDAYHRAARSRVEIACDGGIGRTGTALAILARLDGVRPEDAVAWVRATYRPDAVETPWQRRFVRRARLARLPPTPPTDMDSP